MEHHNKFEIETIFEFDEDDEDVLSAIISSIFVN
jgi:hypothetical protein